MKSILLKSAEGLAVIWQFFPRRFRHLLINGLLILDSRHENAEIGLKNMFAIRDSLELIINERAMAYGDGIHPKHYLTNYHSFFIERINDQDRILDIGCGYGAVARSIALAHTGAKILGIDYDEQKLEQAKAQSSLPNLSFTATDATVSVPDGPWDVIVLSNVLEHIVDRPGFLKSIIKTTHANKILIRVPLFERDWQMALRRELGVDFRSDPDHKIEHQLDIFLAEIREAGLTPVEVKKQSGAKYGLNLPLDQMKIEINETCQHHHTLFQQWRDFRKKL